MKSQPPPWLGQLQLVFQFQCLFYILQISQRHALIRNVSQWRQQRRRRWQHFAHSAAATTTTTTSATTATFEPAQLTGPHAPAQFVHKSVEQFSTGGRSSRVQQQQQYQQQQQSAQQRQQQQQQRRRRQRHRQRCHQPSGGNNKCPSNKCHGFLHAQLFGYHALPRSQIQQCQSQ